MLVEDESLIRDLLSEALQDAGYHVMAAEDGQRAVELAHAPPRGFTGLITDLHMPGGVDGVEVAREFRGAFPGIPVIVISGRPDAIQPRWRGELGFSILRKPFLPSDLVALLRTLLHPRLSHWTSH